MPKPLTIAIFGATGTGKTTIAREVARVVGANTRFCGEEVRAASKRLGIAMQDLPHDIHREIDAATVSWAERQSGIAVLDGRYLNLVLSGVRSEILFVRCDASRQARAHRLSLRQTQALTIEHINAMDHAESEHRDALYGGLSPCTPEIILDTESLDVQSCVQRIVCAIETHK